MECLLMFKLRAHKTIPRLYTLSWFGLVRQFAALYSLTDLFLVPDCVDELFQCKISMHLQLAGGITSSQSPPSLSPSVTPSTFHSRLKSHLFHKSFPPQSFWFMGFGPQLDLLGTDVCLFQFLHLHFMFLVTCCRLSCAWDVSCSLNNALCKTGFKLKH